MDDTQSATAPRYWCHMCNQMVDPVIDAEMVGCPTCQSGFVEQMDSSSSVSTFGEDHQIPDDYFGGGGIESDSDRALSLWAPVLLGMMSNPRRRRRFRRRLEFEYRDYDDNHGDIDHHSNEGETELDRELQSFIRRRRRNSATILQYLQGIRAGILSESNNSEVENGGVERDTTEIRDRNRVILINPINQTIILQGGNSRNHNHDPGSSLGDYFIGPGLDLLLQHLAENDPNRYGTPPAKKEAVEAMPCVKIAENVQCTVCLDDLEIGMEAKEMPCKHKFHGRCILPWLELHSSCPVCRYQLPSDGCKLNSEEPANNNNSNNNGDNSGSTVNNDNGSSSSSRRDDEENSSSGGRGSVGEESNEDGRIENRRRFSVPFPWPLSNLFSSGNRSSSSSSSTNATRNASQTDEN